MFSAVVSWQLWCGDAVTIIRSPSPSSQNINWFWEVHFRDTRVRVQSSDEVSECLLEDNELREDYIWKNNLNTFETTFYFITFCPTDNRKKKQETFWFCLTLKRDKLMLLEVFVKGVLIVTWQTDKCLTFTEKIEVEVGTLNTWIILVWS